MRITALIFMFVYGVVMAFSPIVNTCICQRDSAVCAHKQTSKSVETPKSCCSKSTESKTTESPESSCGKTKGICCSKCVKLVFVLHQGFITIAAPDYSLDYAHGQSGSLDNISSPDFSHTIKKPPGRMNLSLHIKSTVIRC